MWGPRSHSHESVPLRRRENDSFATHATHRFQDTVWEDPHHPPHHNHTVRRRKRSNGTDGWVHTAMKAVLLSPVVVLCLWGVVAVSWNGNSHRNSNINNNYANQAVGNQRRRTSRWGNHRRAAAPQQAYDYDEALPLAATPRQNGRPLIVQPVALEPPRGQSVPVVPAVPQQLQQQYSTFAPQAVQAIDLPAVTEQQYALPPREAQPIALPAVTEQQRYYTFPPQEAVQPVALPAAMAQQYYTFPPQTAQQTAIHNGIPLASTLNLPQGQPLPQPIQGRARGASNAVPPNYVAPIPQAVPLERATQQAPPLGAAATHMSPPHWHLRHADHPAAPETQHVRYFYYDPKAMRRDETTGHWHLPQFVTDSLSGRRVSVQALSAVAPILVQQPPATVNHFNSTMMNGTAYNSNTTIGNYSHTHPNVVNTRQKRTLTWPTSLWGGTETTSTPRTSATTRLFNPDTTTAADKSLLVCTVGVMALLVGAVSARRLRHRSIVLSLCVDGDAAMDEEAPVYGNATTHSYHTFGSGGWKGDLEKFDV